MATCTMAMQRDHGLPATFPAFRTSMDVWFHSVTVSAPAWPAVRAIASVASRSDSHRRLLAPSDTLRGSCLDARPSRENEYAVSGFMTASESRFEIPPETRVGRATPREGVARPAVSTSSRAGDRGRPPAVPPCARGGIVAVVVPLADGRDGAPGIVHVADLEACDVGISHGHVHEGQEASAVPGIEAA